MLPLAGSIRGRLIEVREVSIHGDRYLDLIVQRPEQEGTAQATKLRAPIHAIKGGEGALTPGVMLNCSLLMGQVTGVEVENGTRT